jgi:hypothetical protein
VLAALLLTAASPVVDERFVRAVITPLNQLDQDDIQRISALGPQVLPHLVRIYESSSEDDRAVIAWIFYRLGWKSSAARAALLKDIDTQHSNLRLQVQWALGRVSDDTEVVDILAGIMRNDANPLFRDKAACALAYDQIHLTEKQKVRLYGKLIEGLADEKAQVRAISILALKIHTGQTKGYQPDGPVDDRTSSIARWKIWLAEYEKNL